MSGLIDTMTGKEIEAARAEAAPLENGPMVAMIAHVDRSKSSLTAAVQMLLGQNAKKRPKDETITGREPSMVIIDEMGFTTPAQIDAMRSGPLTVDELNSLPPQYSGNRAERRRQAREQRKRR